MPKKIHVINMLMCVLNINLLCFFALQRLRLRRLVIGLEQRDFHSTPSYMKVTHTHAHTQTDTQTCQSPGFTQLSRFTQRLPPFKSLLLFIPAACFLSLSLSLPPSLCLIFSIISVSLSFSAIPPSSHPRLLGHCVLFPGFSSCPEGGVMGKALLSLLGLSELLCPALSLLSSTFLLLPTTPLPVTPPSKPVFSYCLFLSCFSFSRLSSFHLSGRPTGVHSCDDHLVSYS